MENGWLLDQCRRQTECDTERHHYRKCGGLTLDESRDAEHRARQQLPVRFAAARQRDRG